MISNLPVAVAVGVLVACGIVLLLERGIVRSYLGILLLGNGVNLLFMAASGRAGAAPIIGTAPTEELSDPLPQAMVLTAIVITLALTGFMLALAHRSWQVSDSDTIVDDEEDARIAKMAAEDDMSDSDFGPGVDELDPGDDPDPGGHHPNPVTQAIETVPAPHAQDERGEP